MPNGLYFSRVAAMGEGKPNAELDFNLGFNIISGASETGKSYFMDCIDFILGARQPPKNIAQAVGYDRIRAEIRTTDGRCFTLNRYFNQNKIIH